MDAEKRLRVGSSASIAPLRLNLFAENLAPNARFPDIALQGCQDTPPGRFSSGRWSSEKVINSETGRIDPLAQVVVVRRQQVMKPNLQSHSKCGQAPHPSGASRKTNAPLRCVARALSAKVRVVLEPEGAEPGSRLAESPIPYRVERLLQPAAKRSFRPRALRTAFRLARLGLPRRESWRERLSRFKTARRAGRGLPPFGVTTYPH